MKKSRLLLPFLLLWVSPAASPAASASEVSAADAKAKAYYHFTLGHLYQELAGPFRRSEYLRRAIEEYKKALHYDPRSTEVVVQLAEAYRTSGRIRDAVVETRQLLEKDPDNLAAHRLLGRIYFETLGEPEPGRPPRETLKLAIEEYQHIVRLDPLDIDSRLTLARLHRMNNDLEAAEEVLKGLLALEPQSEQGLAALASIYMDRGDHDRATQLLQSVAQGTSSAGVMASLAFAYEQGGEQEQAIEAYRRALQLDSENVEIRRRLADVLLQAERVEEALEQYRAVTEVAPDDAEAFLRLSQIYRHQQNFEEAWEALETAKELAPDNLEIGFNEALLYEAEGNFDGAIAVLSEMLGRLTRPDGDYSPEEQRSRAIVVERLGSTYRRAELFDQAAEVFELLLPLNEEAARRGYLQIGETYRQARQPERGVEALRAALERFPEDTQVKLQLAGLLSDTGQLEDGVNLARSQLSGEAALDRQVYMTLTQMYERHKRWPEAEGTLAEAERLAVTEGDLEFVYFLRGALHERQEQYEKAEEAFRRVLELNPESAITLNYLGYMFADNGVNLEEAVELLEKANRLDPYNGAYLDSLGWAYYRLQQFDLAEKYLSEAVKFLSRDPTIHDHLGDLYYATGRLEAAEEAWERAREEWQRVPRVEFDAEAFARLEEKLHQLKNRLAQESPKKASNP